MSPVPNDGHSKIISFVALHNQCGIVLRFGPSTSPASSHLIVRICKSHGSCSVGVVSPRTNGPLWEANAWSVQELIVVSSADFPPSFSQLSTGAGRSDVIF